MWSPWFSGTIDRWLVVIATLVLLSALLDAVVLIPLRYRYTWYSLDSKTLTVESGRFVRRRHVYPVSRLLYCETRQGPVVRHLGLTVVTVATLTGSRSVGPLSPDEALRFESVIGDARS